MVMQEKNENDEQIGRGIDDIQAWTRTLPTLRPYPFDHDVLPQTATPMQDSQDSVRVDETGAHTATGAHKFNHWQEVLFVPFVVT